MGLLDQLSAALGGNGNPTPQLQSIANGQGDFSSPDSTDHAQLNTMVSQASPGVLGEIFSKVASQMSPQQYTAHVAPQANSASPLGGLESAALGMVASTLMSKLAGGGVSSSGLLSRLPGLGTTDPAKMNASDVAQVAQYTQQNHAEIFGQAASQVAQQQPGLLGALLGQSGLSQGAAALASHFLQSRGL